MALYGIYERLVRRHLNGLGLGSRTVRSADAELHVYDGRGAAEGGAIYVVIHGIGSSASAYSGLLKRLLPHASRIVAPDLPGHGFSPIPEPLPHPQALYEHLERALVGLFDTPAVVVGTSLGGGLALRFALDHPERVSKLILCSPAGAQMSEAAFAELREAFRMDSPAKGRAFIERLFDRPPRLRSLVGREVKRLLSRPIVQHFLDVADDDDQFDSEEVAALLPATLLIWGRAEKLLPYECLQWYRTHLPDTVTIEEPDGFGHSAHLEVPDALAARILAFAQESR
jgi:pimeloyl-ACP methyl ester carboxylesterase